MSARNDIATSVYQQMRALANQLMHGERENHTLSPTDLVHEAFLRLGSQNDVAMERRIYLFLFARQMRRLLVDYGRRKSFAKHGGHAQRVTYTDGLGLMADGIVDFGTLNNAIEALAEMDQRSAQAIDLCYFTGVSRSDAAQVLEISAATLKRDLHFAQSFIRHYVQEQER